MKLKIALHLIQNDTQHIKGEELDNEIQSQVEGLELEGWEVSSVDIVRGKDAVVEKKEDVERLFAALFAEIESPSAPSKINPKYTKAEIYSFWKDDIKRLLK